MTLTDKSKCCMTCERNACRIIGKVVEITENPMTAHEFWCCWYKKVEFPFRMNLQGEPK